MDYRYLGRTGIRVSPLCLGTMNFSWRTEPQDAVGLVDRAFDAGVNFLDTANAYSIGRSEEIVGQALRRNGRRDHIVLATKVYSNMHKDQPLNPNGSGNSRRQVIEQCHASLRRLQTDWIDLYQVHRPHVDCPIDETLRALDDLVRAGKVRSIGCCNFAAWQVVESLWVADRHSLNRFVTEQPPYHFLDRRIERELVPMAQTYGMGIMPYSPLAGGFLTGKYRRGQPAPTDARMPDRSHFLFERLVENDRAHDAVEQIERLAEAKGCTLSQFAIAWCMNQPGITSPIIGPRTLAQLEDNLKAMEVQLTDDERKAVDDIVPPGRMIVPFYESFFGPHTHRWS